jgi:hypothetical protein
MRKHVTISPSEAVDRPAIGEIVEDYDWREERAPS